MSLSDVSSISQAIQEAQYEDAGDDAANWRITHTFAKIDKQWLKISFDHKFCNGLDSMKLFKENKDNLATFIRKGCSERFTLKDNICWAEVTQSLDGERYKGSSAVDAKSIIRDFFEQFAAIFYIPIDMHHAFGQPTLLNYTFNPSIGFEDNWNEVRRIKKNTGNFLCADSEWKKYIVPQKAWVTCMTLDISNPFTFAHYEYDPVYLQGLGVCITEDGSYWSFDFYCKPEMKKFFIEKYSLSFMEV